MISNLRNLFAKSYLETHTPIVTEFLEHLDVESMHVGHHLENPNDGWSKSTANASSKARFGLKGK